MKIPLSIKTYGQKKKKKRKALPLSLKSLLSFGEKSN